MRTLRLPLVLCATLVLVRTANAAMVADHNSVTLPAVPDPAVAAAASLRVHLRRASVGGNISDGLDALQSANAKYDRGRWVFGDRGNPGWQAKVDDLVSFTAANASSYDVISMKFCFIDPDASFTYYRDALLQLEASYPGKIFVWWTIPIETTGDTNRQAFNDEVRTYAKANGKPLFDIADIEAYGTAGTRSLDSSGRELQAEDWSSDGGHLNDAGGQRVASAWWWLMARLAGWGIHADHSSVTLSAIPDSAVGNAAALRTHLRHASVGGNINGGLDALHTANAKYDRSRWIFYNRGNLGWRPKVDDLVSFTAANAPSYDVLSMKFCYIDPDASFTYYRDAVLQLETNYPGKIFVWWTIPLETSGNANRQAFNDQVRAYTKANGKPLFDIADIETYNASNAERLDSSGRQIMWSEWTSDGGHLSTAGAQRVASAWWWLMARLAGWRPLNPIVGPQITIDDATVTETNGATQSLTLRIRLSAPSSTPVTVEWATSPTP